VSAAVTAILEGMPQPTDLRCARVDDQVVVTVGSILLFTFDSADVGMRNLAVATLRSLRFSGQQVAAAFGLSAQYVATVYSRSLREGSAGLVRASGRPGKLSKRQLAQVISWHENGLSNVEIGRRLGVHNSTISRALSGAKATSSDATTEPVTDQLNLLNHTECGETELNTSPDIEPEFDGSSLDVECDTECGETELNTSLDIESEFDGSSLDVECDTECGETELSTDEGVECEPGERAGVEVSVCVCGWGSSYR
jgi:transposase